MDQYNYRKKGEREGEGSYVQKEAYFSNLITANLALMEPSWFSLLNTDETHLEKGKINVTSHQQKH